MQSALGFPATNPEGLGFDLPLDEWQMTLAERCTLATILQALQPDHAIEVGTARGGSLAVLAKFSRRVYSIDHDPTCSDRLARRHPNVEFLTGPSPVVLAGLLERLEAEGSKLGFVLLDGDHSRKGVQGDLEAVLRFRPITPLYVIVHDSFNPACRDGILTARWGESPYVHGVEVDFLPGSLHSDPRYYRQLWDGFAAGLLLPSERKGELTVHQSHRLEYEALRLDSIWSPRPWKRLWARAEAARMRHRNKKGNVVITLEHDE